MAKPRHVTGHLGVIQRGASYVDTWRLENPGVQLDLFRADLTKADLTEINLTKANLHIVSLTDTSFSDRHLSDHTSLTSYAWTRDWPSSEMVGSILTR